MLLVLVGCGTQHEDKESLTTTDKVFVKTVRAEISGVKNKTDEALVDYGHNVCTFAENQDTYQAVISWTEMDTGLTLSDSAYFAGASVAAYCPQHTTMFPGS